MLKEKLNQKESMSSQFDIPLQTARDLAPSFLDNTLDRLKGSKSWQRITTIMAFALIGSGAMNVSKVSAESAYKQEPATRVASGESILAANDDLSHFRDGGPIPVDPEMRSSAGLEHRLQLPSTEQETDPRLIVAAVFSAKLTPNEVLELAKITPVASKDRTDLRLSGPTPAPNGSFLTPDLGSALEAQINEMRTEGGKFIDRAKQENPDVPVANMVLVVHEDENGNKVMTVTMRLNQEITPSDNLSLKKGALLVLTEAGIRYMEPIPRLVDGVLIDTDSIQVVTMTQNMFDRLTGLGLKPQPVGSTIEAQVAQNGDLLAILTGTATALYDQKTGQPINPISGQRVDAISTSVAPEVAYNPAAEASTSVINYAPLITSDGKTVNIITENGATFLEVKSSNGDFKIPTTELKVVDFAHSGQLQEFQPGITYDTVTKSHDHVNVTGYIKDILLTSGVLNGEDIGYDLYELVLVVPNPEMGTLTEARVVTVLGANVMVSNDGGVSFIGTPTPDAIKPLHSGQMIQIRVENQSAQDFESQWKTVNAWNNVGKMFLQLRQAGNPDELVQAYMAGKPMSTNAAPVMFNGLNISSH